MPDYNLSRAVALLLAETESTAPSFTVNLYPEHWTLNQGSKFLYNNPVAVRRCMQPGMKLTFDILYQSLLDDIRAQRIPVDLLETFDSSGVPFYDGM